ncbi:hypothetical protein Desku_2795 [Desulfofundulus kuznetsovii DSM 6115]|uniref:SpoOB alpha-helical domain-containing protein n=1 Tax=Desulfofundulus kuznetsovii (strain DSM 6115 / VKM B-1805 / 17) TaxID=760568 RepID=A0AAU8PDN5_DESK7|nr:hypothetical protein Desku_2795 [Desulfofundulus kuznetsovii DSM 6115]
MSGLNSLFIHLILHLYHGLIVVGVALALSLILNGYDIKENWQKFVIATLVLGIAFELFYYFPQLLRIILLVITFLAFLKFYFGFSIARTFFISFTLYFIFLMGEVTFSIVLVFVLRIPMNVYYASPLIRLVFPFYNIPFVILAYFGHRRHWTIFRVSEQVKMPFQMVLPLLIQVTLLSFTLSELIVFAQPRPSTLVQEAVTVFTLLVSTLLSFFYIWRILRFAEREAVASAQEKLAEEMRREIDILRGQRHDFINHVQIIAALLSEGRKEELARYVKALKEGLT